MNIGVLCINTGTPDEPSIEAIQRYLREFLMDPAIIGAPKFIRKRIVEKTVKERPYKTIKNYQEFWTEEDSPYRITCQNQCELLEESLRDYFSASEKEVDAVTVVSAMRYGNPSIASGLRTLRDAGCDVLVLFPTYPQQVKVCAGTCLKEAHTILEQVKAEGQRSAAKQKDKPVNPNDEASLWNPQVYEIPYFYDLPSYRQALANSVKEAWEYTPGSKLLLSFHSTLLKDIEKGDVYQQQVEQTRSNLASDLGIPDQDVLLGYQSRFDSRKWLQPFVDKEVVELAEQNVTNLCVICPIFIAKNTETEIEIKRDLKATYLNAAGEGARFVYVEELNCSEGLIEAMRDAVIRVLD
ncbi:MAG: ferrochelatase [Anaerotardibacter sp.]